MSLHNRLTLALLENYWQTTPKLHKLKNIVFEVSTYGTVKPPYRLIACAANIGKTHADAVRKRKGLQLDGHFAYEYDGWQFVKDIDGSELALTAEVLGSGLAETLDVFAAFAQQKGFAAMKSLDFFDKNQCLYHIWMGEEVGESADTPLTVVNSWLKELEKEVKALTKQQKVPVQNLILYFSGEDFRFEGYYFNAPGLKQEQWSSYPSTEGSSEYLVKETGVCGLGTPLAMNWQSLPLEMLNAWLPFLKATSIKAIHEDVFWKYQQALGGRMLHLLAALVEKKLAGKGKLLPPELMVVPMVHDSALVKAEYVRVRTLAPAAYADYLLRG